jgi:hypothetical protein
MHRAARAALRAGNSTMRQSSGKSNSAKYHSTPTRHSMSVLSDTTPTSSHFE